MRAAIYCLAALISSGLAQAGESPADDAIAAAIAVLEAKLDETDDTLARAKIQRAIHELETLLADDAEKPAADPVSFEVKPAVLRKKFQGKAVYEPKSGLLSISYNFAKKDQVKDYEFTDAKPIIANRVLLLDGSDRVTHLAKFKTFTVKGIWGLKAMRGGGVGSTNGSHMGIGGANPDTLYLGVAEGEAAHKIVPDEFRSGTIGFQFSISPAKTSLQYANERLSAATVKKDDIHQVTFHGGTEGYAFSSIVISGVPEPKWFQEFLEAK